MLEDRYVPSTLTVTSTRDWFSTPNDGTLRGEIFAARSGDTIVFDPSLKGQTIHLVAGGSWGGSGPIGIRGNLNIQGLGAANLAISGSHSCKVFLVVSGAQVTINGLTIEDGNSLDGGFDPGPDDGLGGAIYNAGTLTLSNCTLSGNTTLTPAGKLFQGGAIYNTAFATMTLNNCTVTNNSSGQGGGIFNAGTMTISGCSVTSNTVAFAVAFQGGGVFNAGTLAIVSSTVTGNSSGNGAGIYNASGSLTISAKSVVCDNFDTSGAEDDLYIAGGTVNISQSKVCKILPQK
jgi:hypothetical protein